jgi:hypothetical protein
VVVPVPPQVLLVAVVVVVLVLVLLALLLLVVVDGDVGAGSLVWLVCPVWRTRPGREPGRGRPSSAGARPVILLGLPPNPPIHGVICRLCGTVARPTALRDGFSRA